MVCARERASGSERGLRSRRSLLVALSLPAAASAQTVAAIDGTPMNVYADGLGAIQVRLDTLPAGLFFDPEQNPAHAGLEITQGDQYFPLEGAIEGATGRVAVTAPAVTDLGGGTQVLRSAYDVGPSLQVSESLTYTNGSTQIGVHYDIANRSATPVSIRAGELADLFVGANDSGNGVISSVAPRFVGGRDESTGLVYGLQELTPWAGLQEGDFELVFDNFAAGALSNTVDSAAPDNGVGVEFKLDDLAPGETRPIDVRWLLAAPAPPGTTSPSASGGAHGILPPPGRQVRQRQARQRHRPLQGPGEQDVRHAQGSGPGPDRHDLRHAQGSGDADLRGRFEGRHAARLVLLRCLQSRPEQGRQPDHGARAGRGQAELQEGLERIRRGRQEEAAQAVGRRRGQVPHARAVQLRDGSRHQVGRDRPLRRDADTRRARHGGGARLRPPQDGHGLGREAVPRAQAQVSWVSVLAGFLVAHMVGDYLLQTDWQARHKRNGLAGDPVARRALFSHVSTYTLAFAPALVWIASELDAGWAIAAAFLIFLPHLVVDDGRVVRLYLSRVKRADGFDVGLAASVDQSFHILSLFLVAILVGAA